MRRRGHRGRDSHPAVEALVGGAVVVLILSGTAITVAAAWAGAVASTSESFRSGGLGERQPTGWDAFLVVPRDLAEGAHLRASYWRVARGNPGRGKLAFDVEIQRDLDGDGTADTVEQSTIAGRVRDHSFEGTIGPLAPLRAGDLVLFAARLKKMPVLAPYRRADLEVALLDSAASCPTPRPTAGDVTRPRPLARSPRPQYTEEARLARITGTVILQSILDCDGQLTRFRVLKPLDPGLDQESFETLSQWRYAPARLDGVPVRVFFNFTVNFQLQAAAASGSAVEPQVTVEGRLIDPRPPAPPGNRGENR